MRRLLMIISAVVVVPPLVLAGLVLLHGFPVKYMDLNDDQFISPAEVIRSLNLGRRTVRQGNTTCVEIFELEDGQAIKHICW